jgi:molybdopterin-guanine dinucleotide biosynthesis protein A
MGGDKARLPWPSAQATEASWRTAPAESVTLLERAASSLGEFCFQVEVAAGSQVHEAWPSFPDAMPAVPVEGDGSIGAGPLAGLVAALERTRQLRHSGTAVLACDMPLVEPEDFTPLLESLRAGADVAMWTVQGSGSDEGKEPVDQPLVAVYGPRVLPAARAAFDGGARRLVAIGEFPAADGRHLRVDRLLATENSFRRLVNVNTPSDYHGAVAAYLNREPRDRGGAR